MEYSAEITTSILCWILFALCSVYLVRKCWQRLRWVSRFYNIPTIPRALPILGNVLDIPWRHDEIPDKMRYYFSAVPNDGILLAWLGPRPFIFIFSSEKAKVLLSSTRNIDKTVDYNFLHPWLGTGLLTSSNRKWVSRKKIISGAFHGSILEEFIPALSEEAQVLVRKLDECVDKGTFNVVPMLTLCALDAICSCVMGVRIHAQLNGSIEYVKAIHRMTEIIQTRQLNPLLWNDTIFKLTSIGREHDKCLVILHNFTLSVIQNRRMELMSTQVQADGTEYVDGQRKRRAFLDQLLEAADGGRVLSDQDIREEVDTFMFAGHDTSAASLSWIFLMIGIHPEVQRNLQEEMNCLFGDDVNSPASSYQLKNMKQVDHVIKESLRLFPPVPIYGRELKEDLVVGHYSIPAGTSVAVLPAQVHQDKNIFSDADEFRPDRWNSFKSGGVNSCTYIPFSSGPRSCLGQQFAMLEMKVIVSTVVRRFEILATDLADTRNISNIPALAEIVFRPANGVNVKLQRRHVS